MEIHQPHAAKTWKEFFIELGTIVLGILIALSLEQAVESWREHRQYVGSLEAMRAELASNLASLAPRQAVSACAQKRTTEIAALLDKAERHETFDPPSWVGEANSFRMRFAAESEAGQSGLFSPAEQRQFISVYTYMHSIETEEDRERQAWVRLQPLEGRSSLPPEMIPNLREALAEVRFEDERMRLLVGFAKRYAAQLSLTVTPVPASNWPQAWALCLPMSTPREDALRRINYPDLPPL